MGKALFWGFYWFLFKFLETFLKGALLHPLFYPPVYIFGNCLLHWNNFYHLRVYFILQIEPKPFQLHSRESSRKRRTKSLQPNVVSWDVDNNVAVEPELLGSVIEKFLTNKRNSLEKSPETKSRTRSLTTAEKLNRASPPDLPLGFRSGVSRDEKRFIVVDEFDHPRRLSFGGSHSRKLSCRSEDSVENALKKLNIWNLSEKHKKYQNQKLLLHSFLNWKI